MVAPQLTYVLIYLTQIQIPTTLAWQTLAHRGLSRDVNDHYALAENTFEAMLRAAEFGLPGVELDIRLTRDGIPIIAHDHHGSRETTMDGSDGLVNPLYIALEESLPEKLIEYEALPWWFWKDRALKVYGRGGRILQGNGVQQQQKLESLEDMLGHLKDLGRAKPEFRLVLDIQTPRAFRASAALIKKHGMGQQVLLKFFAKRALDSSTYKYTGPETCAIIAQQEGFNDLQIIPQFNNGEMTLSTNGESEEEAFISVLQTNLSISQYLDCWYHAAHNTSTIQMPIIATSVPRPTPENTPFTNAAVEALKYASSHGLKRMAIGPNPSVGRFSATSSSSSYDGGGGKEDKCTYFKFAADKLQAKIFDQTARDAKLYFAKRMLREEDFLVGDAMGDVEHHRWSTEFGFFVRNLC